ncbi:hypothetical protein DRO58_03685 [Candidatus Bathyarchaeota archaeon]|nr:MAG: hypothetical protein DRO58_03685 [Candidatus Bathyarchaeota archaeon]
MIGTMALLLTSLFVVTSFVLLGTMTQMDLVKPQLREVAEYVASNIVDLVTLADQTDVANLILVKKLIIPASVGERGYRIELSDGSVIVYLGTLQTVRAETPINLNTSSEVIINGEIVGVNGLNELVEVKGTLFSGSGYPLVWCVKEDGTIYVGLGVLKSSTL